MYQIQMYQRFKYFVYAQPDRYYSMIPNVQLRFFLEYGSDTGKLQSIWEKSSLQGVYTCVYPVYTY